MHELADYAKPHFEKLLIKQRREAMKAIDKIKSGVLLAISGLFMGLLIFALFTAVLLLPYLLTLVLLGCLWP